MKPYDVLSYMELADSSYVEEASDYNLLLLRKHRKRTRLVAAACLALVVLTGALIAKPALYAWESRNTVTSWSTAIIRVPGAQTKPTPSIYVSAEMPAKKKFSADASFPLSVGMGQRFDYDYATLSIKAPGFEITDKDGNTAIDRYVRTFSGFNSGDYGMLYQNGRITGCEYVESFTFRYVGPKDSETRGGIDISLMNRDEGSRMGDVVTVYYSVKNGVLKLTDKRPADNGVTENGGVMLEEVTEGETVIPTQDNISVSTTMKTEILKTGQYLRDFIEITARVQPRGEIYPTDNFTAELVYAETAKAQDYTFYVKVPAKYGEIIGLDEFPITVPDNAPVGSYDLRITDLDTGFTWIYENMAWVLPTGEKPYGIYEDDDWICTVSATKPSLMQGEDHVGVIHVVIQRKSGDDLVLLSGTKLVYAEDESYTITLSEPIYSSTIPPMYIPVDAPVGHYDLVVANMWRFENFMEITANTNREQERFEFHYVMDEPTVSRSAGKIHTVVAMVENRGDAFLMRVTAEKDFEPEATLVSSDGLISLPLQKTQTAATFEPYDLYVRTGMVGTVSYDISPLEDIPCGVYDLVLFYENCSQIFSGAVEIVE